MQHFRQLQQLLSFLSIKKNQFTARLLLALMVCLLAIPGITRTWYIAPTNSGNGSANSWANASSDLTNALDNAVSGDQIWIKTGTYRRYDDHSFQLKTGVKLYGGFAGTESSIGGRSTNLAAYPVYITNSPTASGTNSTNYDQPVFQIVNTDQSALMDRITFINAFTSAIYNNLRPGVGAAIYMSNASPTINNVTFSDGKAEYKGGAVYMNNSSPIFTSCIFSNNRSYKEAGGAIWAENNSRPAFSNTTFSGNTSSVPQGGGSDAVGRGGAIYMRGGKLTLSNVTFTSNTARSDAGAIYLENSTENSSFTNVVFENNYSGYSSAGFGTTGNGAVINAYRSNYLLTNCVFFNNKSGGNGGAIYNQEGTTNNLVPKITNVFFYSNGTSTNNNNTAGAIANDRTSPLITNCTFVDNYCGTSQGAGGVYSFAPSTAPFTDYAKPTIINSLFKRNGYVTATSGGLAGAVDIAVDTRATATVSYSCFTETSTFSAFTNIPITDVMNPFINDGGMAAAKGPDGIWMTADDGFRPSFCTRTMIDKGNNDAISNATSITTDLAGQPRRKDVTLVADSGNGSLPIVDIGAYESQDAATSLSLAGSIGNPHVIPNPQELRPDYVTNTQNPGSGTSILWQKKVEGSSQWGPADSINNQLQYALPTLANTTTYWRVAVASAYCGLQVYSNEVVIKVVNPNGSISGRVISANGTGVPGITIVATRKTAISGGPARYTYTTQTGPDGSYSINRIYYGDPTTNSEDSFSVSAIKQGHIFDFDSLGVGLLNTAFQATNKNFIDRTVLSIVGRTYQACTTCNSLSGAPQTQTCPIDSITIYKDGLYNTISGFIDTAYGRYAVAITDPVPTRIEPRLAGHTFAPHDTTLTPTNNVSGVDFKDTTTHTITGKFTAGCNEFIGTAVLEFTDVLPNAPDGSTRNSCFRKRVTTAAGTGAYSIRLPARKYKVRVISFTPATGANAVTEADVTNFLNARTPADSLIRDISTHDTTLNLLYIRPPVVSITQGLNVVCVNPQPFALIKQGALDSFKVLVFQGPATLGCPLADTNNKITIKTNVQQEDALDSIKLPVADTGVIVKVRGGIPNITGDHLKDLFVYFTDKYGRTAASFNRKVLVTGVRPDAATFTTVSPQVPLVVLHDPPGDASYSTWQQNKSISNAVRFYSAKNVGGNVWAEAKVGGATTVGILGAFFDISAWGKINASVGVNAATTSSNEAIITTTTSQSFSTSSENSVTGDDGDVYIGAALNLIYSVATDISYTGCGNITSARRLIIADSGFATTFIYSQNYITNVLIPNLQSFVPLNNPADSAKYQNQIKVWQQVVANNAENKRRAAFVQNYSFDGAAGAYTNSTTTSSAKSSSVEFGLEINTSIATELGFEIAGSGVSGGVNVNFRMETGNSETNSVTDETTISYTLDDNTPGDYFSVNVKKDPVYNTPVFELAAGTASCPPEPGAQPRDDVFFTANNPVAQNVNPTAAANFNLKIVNTSASTGTNPNDKRTYKLNYAQSSNVANETITIAGTPYNSSSPYITRPLGYLDSVIVPVSITRQSGSSVYSYEGEQFSISSSCDDDLGKAVAVSAYFTSPCSGISLAQPTDGWVLNATGNNQIFVKPSDYILPGLSSVNVQYSTGNTWRDGDFLTNAQLATGFYFDVSSLSDGPYGIRLRLDCSTGTVFSQRASGIIDRRAPQLFGRPTPTDDRYVNGEDISFTYDEKLNTNANGFQVTMRRLSNNTLIPATASIFDNKIIVVPNNSIAGLTGDSIRVVVASVSDLYGNIKMKADTVRFTVGTSVVGTGNRALTVSITNPTVYKNDTAAIRVIFTLPANATNDTRVNYTIGGTARYSIDYAATYTGADALYASFNGSTGSIKIPTGSRTATLTLRPIVGDTSYSPDKTIIISASEGGDYVLGATTSVTGNLTSEDGVNTYTFTGDGNWNLRTNWLNSKMPLTTLVAPKEIIINPIGTCTLNVAQTIRTGAKITVKQNRRFVIQGNLKLN